jgi:hypothetical protein
MVQLTTFSNLNRQKNGTHTTTNTTLSLRSSKLASTTCVPKKDACMQILVVGVRVFVAQ